MDFFGFFFQAEDGIRDYDVTGVQTCALPIFVSNFNLDTSALGHLTSAVQFGFITGTLIFALLTISARFPPSKVFFISALVGALCNLGSLVEEKAMELQVC